MNNPVTVNKKKHVFLLTFDLEEFTIPQERAQISVQEHNLLFKYGQEGTKLIINLLKRQNIPAAIFCTYDFFYKFPELIQELKGIGCEIALHAYAHDDDYRTMNEKQVIQRLGHAKKEMEKKLGITINGFRGPGFRAPSLDVLKKIGFTYDSSLHPTWVPGHYCNILKSRKIKKIGNICEIPISVVPFVRLPFSWVWFRNLPLIYAKAATSLNMYSSSYTLIYFHSWEFVDIPLENYSYQDIAWKAATRNIGTDFEKKLEKYVVWAKKRGTFLTIQEYLDANESP